LVRDFSPGKLTNTGNPFNVAISGPGFFQVMTGTGDTGYTRNGSFQTDPEGNLVTHDGLLLHPGIKIASDAVGIEITSAGAVRLIRSDGTEVVGHLQVFIFPNEQGLRILSDTLFVPTTASGSPLAAAPLHGTAASFHQGFLESSNAVVTTEDMRLFQLKQWYSAIMAKVSGSSGLLVVQALAVEKP
jgi:flagellar basal-body rod protein FlgG